MGVCVFVTRPRIGSQPAAGRGDDTVKATAAPERWWCVSADLYIYIYVCVYIYVCILGG